MNDVPFHLTRMGRTFFESTMPALVRELERLNKNLERVLPAGAGLAEGGPEVKAGEYCRICSRAVRHQQA